MHTNGFVSRRKNDCVPAAIAGYCNVSYDEVHTRISNIGGWLPDSRCAGFATVAVLWTYDFRIQPIPRRGQDSMNGIVRFTSGPKSRPGHLAALVNGYVFCTLEPNGLALDAYRKKYTRSTIVSYWTRQPA